MEEEKTREQIAREIKAKHIHDTLDKVGALIKVPFKETEAIRKYYDCYRDIISVMNYYMDIPEESSKLISLWILGTYTHKEFNSYPFLFLNAMRGSGKSRMLNLISSLCKDGQVINNVTEAVLFRTAKDHTIIMDEIESIVKKDKQGFRELLNSAYKKGTTVKRMKKVKGKEGDEMKVEEFDLYTPVCMANISGMEEVLSDRCITIILEKSDNKGKTKLIEDFDDNEIIRRIKRTLEENQCSLCNVVSQKNIKRGWNNYISDKYNNYIYTLYTYTTLTTLTTLDKDLELFNKIDSLDIDGRNLELFFPLLNIASLIDDMLIDEILSIAKDSVTQKKRYEAADSPDVSLYELISKKDPLVWYPITDLLNDFKHYYTSDEGDREWLNTKWLGRALRRLKLVVDDRRRAQGMQVLLDVSKSLEKSRMFKTQDDIPKSDETK